MYVYMCVGGKVRKCCKEASYIYYVREERSKNLDRVGRKVPRHVQTRIESSRIGKEMDRELLFPIEKERCCRVYKQKSIKTRVPSIYEQNNILVVRNGW